LAKRKKSRNPAVDAAQYRLAEAVAHGTARTKTSMTKKAARELIEKTPARLRSQFMKNAGKKTPKHRRRKNPEDTSIAAYEDFHGKKPTVDTVVETPVKYHSNLAGLGRLEWLKVKRLDGRGVVTIEGFGKNCLLAENEARNQLFIVGGDQKVDLKVFGLSGNHERQVLGTCSEVAYFTNKKHLIEKDGGEGVYVHKFGKRKGRKTELPFIVYDVRNKLLSFAGGGYTIPSEGIDG